MNEIWQDVDGYKGCYQVSNLGRVRNKNGKILKSRCRKDGYFQINLSFKGDVKTFQVHRLVAQAFIPNPQNLPQINHKDRRLSNNKATNLEWCDAKYNSQHRWSAERSAA